MNPLSKYLHLRFKEVILTTNGYEVEQHLPVIAQTVTSLVISLNTLDTPKGAQLLGQTSEVFEKVLANINLADQYKSKRCKIHISSVVTPDNINDLYDVYQFAKARGLIFAACPQLVGVKPHASLVNSKAYTDFFDFLIAEKKQGHKIFGTVKYLENMRSLRKFKCHPFTMLVVSPIGDVYYPCLEIGHIAGNLLTTQNLNNIRQDGANRFGPQPNCGNQCHSACALGFSTILEHPEAVISEVYRGLSCHRSFLSR